MELNGFHLPQDDHTCPKCNGVWMAEYDEDEEIKCPYKGCNHVLREAQDK